MQDFPQTQKTENVAPAAHRPYRQIGVSSVAAALDLEIAITAAIDQFMDELRAQKTAPPHAPEPGSA